ncbi:MAG: hypothetical protein K1X55_17340 [Chitinophagales bacterium]|nr:hypothetical protein [Chitinophagales bacterium]
MNHSLKYTDPSGWLKYYIADGDMQETSYVTHYGPDWEGPGRGSGGGWSTHTGWLSTTYTLTDNNGQTAGLNGYQGGENVPGNYLGSITTMTPYTYNTFTMPDYSGAGNVVAPTGDMAAMGGDGGSGASQSNTVHTLESKNNTVFLGDHGDNAIYEFYKNYSEHADFDNIITVFGHGNFDRVGVDPIDKKHYAIYKDNLNLFGTIMEQNTTLWEERNDKQITVFLYNCAVGMENPNGGKNFLQMLSEMYPNVIFIGPTNNTSYEDGEFLGIKNNGNWVRYFNGLKF